ncbi:uncharacterized protein [Nicotiana tomentosiformis]|uniref:uncharacterized protein n=1 Tax=Nicotiana tomentosiformis TaxID=4098 RepID=UPI00388CDF95
MEKEVVELAAFRHRDIAILWYEGWERSRGRDAPPANWENFSDAFLDKYLPREIRQDQVNQFLALKQGNMSVREYSLRFVSLARYAPSIVAIMRDRIHRFIAGLAPKLIEACATAALQDSMDISRIQAFTQNIERGRHQLQGTKRTESGHRKRMRFSRSQKQSQGRYRPQYFERPPRPPPPQLQGYRYDCYTQSVPGESLQASSLQ